MEFIINNKTLKDTIGRISALVEKKSSVPALQGIKFEADSEGLTLQATNLESWVTLKVTDVQVITGGAIVITIPDVEKILMVKDMIRITTNDRFIVSAKSEKKKSSVCGIEVKEYVEFPAIDMNPDTLVMGIPNAMEFCDTLKIVGEAKSDNPAKPIYTGFNFRSDYSSICCVDGFRMNIRIVDWFTDNAVNMVCIGRMEKEIAKIVGKSDRPINVYKGKAASGSHYAVFVGDDYEYFVRLLDGNFLDWKMSVPYGIGESEFTFADTKSMIDTLKEYSKYKSDNGYYAPCKICGYTDNAILTNYAVSSYRTTDKIDVVGNINAEMMVGVNPNYMMSVLKVFNKLGIDYAVKYYGALKPIVITGGDYICLVVPMRVSEDVNAFQYNTIRESIVAEFVA